jgi:deoxyguanosine kinase
MSQSNSNNIEIKLKEMAMRLRDGVDGLSFNNSSCLKELEVCTPSSCVYSELQVSSVKVIQFYWKNWYYRTQRLSSTSQKSNVVNKKSCKSSSDIKLLLDEYPNMNDLLKKVFIKLLSNQKRSRSRRQKHRNTSFESEEINLVNQEKKTRIILSLEGTIGVGKSSGLDWLKKKFATDTQICFIDEPVDVWVKTGILDKMYKGETSPLEFQLFALNTRFARLVAALLNSDAKLIVAERSMKSDMNVFAKVTLKENDRLIYDTAYNELRKAVPSSVTEMNVWLNASSENIRARISKRGRVEESNISDEYLDSLKNAHQEWFDSLPPESKLVLDCNQNPESVG